MEEIEWTNGVTKLNKTTMDQFQNNINDAINANQLPIGAGCDYYGTTLPNDNFAWADGSAISREDYATCFERLGTTYGEGDGSTTFNLPDKRECISIMRKEGSTNGTPGATLDTLGAKGGEFKHTIITDELPNHLHDYDDNTLGSYINSPIGYLASSGSISVGRAYENNAFTTKNAGSDNAINIMQTYLVCNYIIRIK